MRPPLRSTLLAAGVGYLLGTVPSADVAARALGGPDLRSAGSGNPGATNAANVLGAKAGLGVLVADIAKGAIAANVGGRIGAASSLASSAALAQVGGTAAVVGHCLPVWNGFRGGKGVATSVGQVLATHPAYFPIDAFVAIATAADPRWKQRAFAANSMASATWVASSVVWWRRAWPTLWGPPATLALPVGAAASSALIAWRFLSAEPPRPTDPVSMVHPPEDSPHPPGSDST